MKALKDPKSRVLKSHTFETAPKTSARGQREEEVLAPRLRDQLGLLHLHSLARGLTSKTKTGDSATQKERWLDDPSVLVVFRSCDCSLETNT